MPRVCCYCFWPYQVKHTLYVIDRFLQENNKERTTERNNDGNKERQEGRKTERHNNERKTRRKSTRTKNIKGERKNKGRKKGTKKK